MASTQSLKTELFSSLSKQGFHDDIKKQVRIKLVEHLRDKKLIETKTETKQLFKRVLSSLIMQELQITDMPLTDSVYSIESGFEGAHMTRNELIQLLTFNQNQINSNESLLEYILRKKQPFSSSVLQNQQIQTNAQQIGYTLQQKLMMVDQEYRMNLMQKQNLTKNNLFDKKKLQFEWEQRFKKQMDLFKQFQNHKIKIRVSEQWRIKFEDYSNQIAQEYRRKYDLMRKKDKQLNEEYVQKHNQLNMKMNESEKMIQQKIQLLDMKSTTVSAQMQNLERLKKDFENLMARKEKELSDKIREYDNLLLNVKEKIKYQVNLAKLALQQEYQDREAESMRRKKVIDEDYGKLMGIKDSIDIVEKENVRLSNENTNLRNHLTTLEKQLKDIVVQLGNKVSRIQVLKDDLIQMTDVKKNVQEKLKEEGRKSKRYESQIIGIREQVDRLRAKENINKSNISEIQYSEPSVNLERNVESRKIDEVNRRMEKLKNERKKDIQKFKLQL